MCIRDSLRTDQSSPYLRHLALALVLGAPNTDVGTAISEGDATEALTRPRSQYWPGADMCLFFLSGFQKQPVQQFGLTGLTLPKKEVMDSPK